MGEIELGNFFAIEAMLHFQFRCLPCKTSGPCYYSSQRPEAFNLCPKVREFLGHLRQLFVCYRQLASLSSGREDESRLIYALELFSLHRKSCVFCITTRRRITQARLRLIVEPWQGAPHLIAAQFGHTEQLELIPTNPTLLQT